ncbi:alpha/beta fold hydrolase [Caldimonas brevitalea]|uniref:Alpha/beta hydrolase n=1 Tax=Caldimonas brevitalea TaxID=413882 RepID=A0A0G3BGX7_9BURK|nr:alpha/beta fold hydrolase [Caldimonas brevitalea]AKJ28592.1 alpha/beta hydrolase [Caldimonas brevitalea]
MPTLHVNGIDLHYEDQGPRDAPALVLSHSLFFDHRMFQHQALELGQRLRVVRYDDRDQGRSGRSALASVDMDTLADDAAALIEALGLQGCHFAGNSMGGFVALRLAARRPELLRGCIVMGSSGEAEHRLDEFGSLVEAIRTEGTEPFIDSLMYIMFGDSFVADPARAQEREFWRRHMMGLGPDIARAAHGVIHRAGVLDELGDCPVPLLVIAGEQDHAYEVELSRHIAAAAPRAELVVVPHAGHSVALEQPGVVNARIEAFVRDTAGR